MRLLAYESVDGRLQLGLLRLGHDMERATLGAQDIEVLSRALETRRTIVTEDKDFGELVVYRGHLSESVVLVRLDNVEIEERVRRVQIALEAIERANGAILAVISNTNIRLRPILRRV